MRWSNGTSSTRSVGAPRSSPKAAQRFAAGEGLDGGDPDRSRLDHAVDRSKDFHRMPQIVDRFSYTRIHTSLTDVTVRTAVA